MADKGRKKFYNSHMEYIDPEGCGSTLGYRIYTESYGCFYATVDLSDCTRKITWEFGKESDSIDKLDKAVEVLQQFRRELIKAQKDVKKLDAEEETAKVKK